MYLRKHRMASPPALLAWLMTCAISQTATLTIHEDTQGSVNLHIDADPLSYFFLKQSTDLENFTPFSMVLGIQPTTWPLSTEDVPTRFFQVTQISLFAPEDSDGDGIDDVYEIRHPILNPLDGTDAALPSGNGMLTYLQEYRATFGFNTNPPEALSRAVSAFNFGTAFDSAISREIDVFNFGESLRSTISREVSVFNLGAPPYSSRSFSREISVFNGDSGILTEVAEAYSREISLFNIGASYSSIDVVSRETSVFNGGFISNSGIAEVHSRENSVFNFGAPSSSVNAVSREVSILNSSP